MDTDKTFSCRLNKDELEHLERYWNGQFSEYVHSSFKKEVQLTKNNKIKNALQSGLYNIVLLGFGAIFLLFSFNTTNLTGFLLLLLLAVFFMATSLVSIFIELREKWKTSS